MSSSSGLSRTRSMRKPAVGSNVPGQREGPSTRNDPRTTSPSRLPVKPATTTRSTAPSTAVSSSSIASRTRTATSTTGRPPSGVFSKPSSARQDHPGNAAPRPLGRAPSTRKTSSSATTTAAAASSSSSTASTSRSTTTSTGRPSSSGGPPATAANRDRQLSHSRSKSTVTNLTAATTLRPVPAQQPSTASGRTSPTASTTSSGPRTRSQTLSRAKSQTASTQASSQQQKQQHTTTSLASRPAFNTHQQHYSPAKSLAPKPLTSTFLAPPSPSKLPSNVAISSETSRLQTELLQLSLLHRDAAAVDAEWHESARHKLGLRFTRLVAENEALLQRERDSVEARNLSALARWGSRPGLGLEGKIQILDEVLNGVWQLGEPGGRYQRVVQDFEAWADRVADIVAAQRDGNIDALVDGDEVKFLGELDKGWKRDYTGLLRRLEGWQASLRELDLGDDSAVGSNEEKEEEKENTGLARILRGCRALVRDMLAELAVMEQIERMADRAEDEWIERMNRAIAAEDYGEGEEEEANSSTPAAGAYVPLWKLAV
ncbi:hypothetical protein AAE478_003797 [Parahypoxylon ruwenzoriense]